MLIFLVFFLPSTPLPFIGVKQQAKVISGFEETWWEAKEKEELNRKPKKKGGESSISCYKLKCRQAFALNKRDVIEVH